MICSFHSYLSGVGRSFALVNLAELFFKAGLKTLIIDLDLEKPSLDSYLPVDSKVIFNQLGIVDLILGYENLVAKELEISNESPDKLPFEKIQGYIIDVYPSTSASGKLYLITAGTRDNINPDR